MGKKQCSIVFLGDSLTEWGNWKQWFPEFYIYNYGIAGERTDQIIKRLAPIKVIQPHTLFVMMGINDLGNGISPSTIIKNWNIFFRFASNHLISTNVFIQSVLPCNSMLFKNPHLSLESIQIINKELDKMSKQYDSTFINLFELFADHNNQLKTTFTSDGLHLNKLGYKVWRGEIAATLDIHWNKS